jgi:PAS domain S-box-containing protein
MNPIISINIYSILPLVAGLTNLFFGLYVYFINRREKVNRIFFMFCAVISVWCIGAFFQRNAHSGEYAFLFHRISCTGLFFLSAVFLHFMTLFYDPGFFSTRKHFKLFLIYAPSVILSAINWKGSFIFPLDADIFLRYPRFYLAPRAEIFIVFFAAYFLLGIFYPVRKYLKTDSKHEKRHSFFIIMGIVLPLFLGIINDIVLPFFGKISVEISESLTLLFVFFAFMAIERYAFLGITSKLAAESIVSSMRDILIITDRDGKIAFVNESFCQALGYREKDVYGKKLEVLLRPLEDASFYREQKPSFVKERMAELTREGYVKDYDMGIADSNGKVVPFNLSLSPVSADRNEVIETVIIGRDMTEVRELISHISGMRDQLDARVKERTAELEDASRRLKEAQSKLVLSEKMNAMSHLAGGISHEISNPVMGIVGYAGILIDMIPDADAKEKLEAIRTFGFQCMEIINKFCDFAMTSGRDFEDVDIHAVIEDSLMLTKNKLKYDVEVVKEYAPELPTVKGAANELWNVFVNLILNAKDAMPKGGRLRLKTSTDGANVYIVFEDTGKGIPEENIKDLFNPFFTTKKEKGTGLGLSVAMEIVKSHGGDIQISSKLEQGTSVTIRIPVSGREGQ